MLNMRSIVLPLLRRLLVIGACAVPASVVAMHHSMLLHHSMHHSSPGLPSVPARALLAPASASARACRVATDCFLNGNCSAREGTCNCNPGWTGPHCGQFDFLPTPPTPTGGKAFPADPDSSTWGSSVIKVAGRYHMYTSGILGHCGLAVWAPNAALTHAVSDTLDGVYVQQGVIMRGSNPQITQFAGELRLWHSLSGGPFGPGTKGYCASCTNGSTPYACRNESAGFATAGGAAASNSGPRTGGSARAGAGAGPQAPVSAKLIVASDPAGPWIDQSTSCRGWDAQDGCPSTSNPTAYYYPNGTTLLMYDRQSKNLPTAAKKGFFLARAPDVAGPYTPVSGDWNTSTVTWAKDMACTDPFLWRDAQQNFHAVFHCRNWYTGGGSTASGQTGDAGGHAFSADGLHWQLAPEPVWDLTVMHTDGTNTTFFHRERPQVYIDPGTRAPVRQPVLLLGVAASALDVCVCARGAHLVPRDQSASDSRIVPSTPCAHPTIQLVCLCVCGTPLCF